MIKKMCTKCKETKNVEFFSKQKCKPSGYRSHCKTCVRLYQTNNKSVKEYKKEYYNKNKDEILKKQKERTLKTKNKRRERYLKNQEILKEKSRNYKKANRDKVNKYRKNYIPTIHCKVANLLRGRINKLLKLNNIKKSIKTIELIGCSYEFFNNYIESKFTKGMSWENRGKTGWHLDHIVPCCSFDLLDLEQQKICFHYTNIQPLWATKEIAMKYGENCDYIGNLEKQGKFIK